MSELRTNRIEDLQGNPLWNKDDGILCNTNTSNSAASVTISTVVVCRASCSLSLLG